MNTTYFKNLIAGNVFKTKTTPAIPSNIYIGLSTSTPTAAGAATEPSGGAYARINLTSKLSEPGASGYTPALNAGEVTNTEAISFAESTAPWGTVTHYVIYDAATGGNLLMYGALPTAHAIETETVVTIKTGMLKLSVKDAA